MPERICNNMLSLSALNIFKRMFGGKYYEVDFSRYVGVWHVGGFNRCSCCRHRMDITENCIERALRPWNELPRATQLQTLHQSPCGQIFTWLGKSILRWQALLGLQQIPTRQTLRDQAPQQPRDDTSQVPHAYMATSTAIRISIG